MARHSPNQPPGRWGRPRLPRRTFSAIVFGLTFVIWAPGSAGRVFASGPEASYRGVQPEPGWIDVKQLTMLALERESLANAMAAYVVHKLADTARDSAETVSWTRRLLGLALTLHPQNPRAKATDRALRQGIALPRVELVHPSEVLARLLYHRAHDLENGSESDRAMTPFLLSAAAYLSPYYEDAVYESETRRLEHGDLNWKPLIGQDHTGQD